MNENDTKATCVGFYVGGGGGGGMMDVEVNQWAALEAQGGGCGCAPSRNKMLEAKA